MAFTGFVSNKEIRPGEPWVQRIEDNIAICDIFLVLITHFALRNDLAVVG